MTQNVARCISRYMFKYTLSTLIILFIFAFSLSNRPYPSPLTLSVPISIYNLITHIYQYNYATHPNTQRIQYPQTYLPTSYLLTYPPIHPIPSRPFHSLSISYSLLFHSFFTPFQSFSILRPPSRTYAPLH